MSRLTIGASLVCVASMLSVTGVVAPSYAVTEINSAGVDGEAVEAVRFIEDVTGTENLVDVAPGGSSESVSVPLDSDGAVVLSAGGVELRFTQPGVSEETTVSANGTISYVSDSEAFDTHLQVLESPAPDLLSEGVRALIEIQDPTAPREYVFPLNIEPGTELTVLQDGTVVGYSGEDTTLVVPAPWALDAEGSPVPTWYEVRGDALVQHVEFSDSDVFPIVADPAFFLPLIIAGGRVIGQVVVNAATRAAAVRAAAAIAARTVIATVRGVITSTAAKRCFAGAAITGGATSVPAILQERGDGNWQVRFNGNSAVQIVSASVGGCLAANIR